MRRQWDVWTLMGAWCRVLGRVVSRDVISAIAFTDNSTALSADVGMTCIDVVEQLEQFVLSAIPLSVCTSLKDPENEIRESASALIGTIVSRITTEGGACLSRWLRRSSFAADQLRHLLSVATPP